MFKTITKLLRELRKKSQRMYVSGTELSAPQSGYVDIDINTQQGPTTTTAFKEDTRKEVKPVEVVKEILSETPEMDIKNLDEKIKIVKRRITGLKKVLSKDNVSGFRDEADALRYLKARKKYIKYASSFEWAITTEIKSKELCSKYKLRFVGLGGYYRNILMEAIDEIEQFLEAYNKVEKDVEPEFYLIIDDGGKETKKDTILLVSSPFGKWYYVLGAWDKEVEIVDEIIYKGK